ncbi:MAG: PD-(D/E)XK nuclease family protein, partial [Treponema sp.]|nr:PD-(D/E)XK nuclease family protein [Treponema sp.]
DRDTFLKLLLPVFESCPPSLYTLEAIPFLTRSEISGLAAEGKKSNASGYAQPYGNPVRRRQEAARSADPFYRNAELIPEGKAFPQVLEAGKLRYKTLPSDIAAAADTEQDLYPPELSPAEFGSLVHAVLEAKLNRQSFLMPQKILSVIDNAKALRSLQATAESMADSFLDSGLGKRCVLSINHESEFAVITSAAVNDKPIAISGRMDLLFEEENETVVVDFKTDRIENPEDHYGQLASYYRAALDIFGKPVSVWLFYLRSGRAVNVTENIKGLSLEEMAAAVLQ